MLEEQLRNCIELIDGLRAQNLCIGAIEQAWLARLQIKLAAKLRKLIATGVEPE